MDQNKDTGAREDDRDISIPDETEEKVLTEGSPTLDKDDVLYLLDMDGGGGMFFQLLNERETRRE